MRKALVIILFIFPMSLAAQTVPPVNSEYRITDSTSARHINWKKVAEIAALHLAGQFDAYSTHRLMTDRPTGTWAKEYNPLLKPFAGSDEIYPAIGVGDSVLDVWLWRARRRPNKLAAWTVIISQSAFHVWCAEHNLNLNRKLWAQYGTH